MLRSLSDFEGRNVPFICHLRVAEEELMKCFNSEMASLGPTVPSPADGLNGKSRSWLDGCSYNPGQCGFDGDKVGEVY